MVVGNRNQLWLTQKRNLLKGYWITYRIYWRTGEPDSELPNHKKKMLIITLWDWYSESTIPADTKHYLQHLAPPVSLTPDTVSPNDNSTTLFRGVNLSAISPEFLAVSFPLVPPKSYMCHKYKGCWKSKCLEWPASLTEGRNPVYIQKELQILANQKEKGKRHCNSLS